MTAVELPVHMRIALAEYPQCDKRTRRTAEDIERCAKPSEWALRCNHCGATALVCDEHGVEIGGLQRPQACSACNTVGLVLLRWTWIHLRCSS